MRDCRLLPASSLTPGIVCGPAYGRDILDRPARACGFARISKFVGAFGAPLQFFTRLQLAGDAGQYLTKYLRAFPKSVCHGDDYGRRISKSAVKV